jgi:hypothetical protein
LRKWDQVLAVARAALPSLIDRAARAAETGTAGGIASAETQKKTVIGWFLNAAWQLGSDPREPQAPLWAEAFKAAQLAQVDNAGAALSQMSARFAKGDTGLAELVRARQDATRDWDVVDKALIALVADPVNNATDAKESDLKNRQTALGGAHEAPRRPDCSVVSQLRKIDPSGTTDFRRDPSSAQTRRSAGLLQFRASSELGLASDERRRVLAVDSRLLHPQKD